MEKLTSRRNPICIHVKKLGASRGFRGESGEFLCDGLKLLEEAVKCGAEITVVITASPIPFPLSVDTRVYYAQRELLDSLSPLKNAQDTLFVCKMNKRLAFTEKKGTHILLDGVQDPGNVGTIIRTADALGISSVILTGGCADLYNPKTIRATMGAIFRQRVFHMDMPGLAGLRDEGVRFVGASPGGTSVDFSDSIPTDAVIVVGNEGGGISDGVKSLCDGMVSIPISAECESLNVSVAAAILMWETARRSLI